MPFTSKAQQAYLYAKEPEVAKEFAKGMSKKDFADLPEHKRKLEAMKRVGEKEKR